MGTGPLRHPRAGARITPLHPGGGQRASARPRPHPRIGKGVHRRDRPPIATRVRAPRHPRVAARVTRLQPGIGQRAGPRPQPRIGTGTRRRRQRRIRVGASALRHLRAGAGITRLQPGVSQRASPRPHLRAGTGTRRRRQPRIRVGAGPLRHPRAGARVTRLQPGIGRRAGASPRPHPRIRVGASALRHPRVGAGIYRLQPGVGRRAWPWACGRTSATGRARIGRPAVAGPPATIVGGRAPPGAGGFLRTSVSHASPLRPAERNPSWPSSAKSLHHAASAGGAATWSAGVGLSALVAAWPRPNRSRAHCGHLHGGTGAHCGERMPCRGRSAT